jgi:TonB family protein
LTQEEEEALKIAEAKRKQETEAKRRQEAEERRRKAEEAERARQAEQERRAQAAINNQVSGAFGRGNGAGSGQAGNTTGSGQGDNPFGTGGGGSSSGGGYGSFNLDGRSLKGALPRPSYTVQDEGRIVIDITVDPQGNVILAEIGRGTNITNASMRQSAIEAAGKAKFSSISNNTNNQRGTITYNYSLK